MGPKLLPLPFLIGLAIGLASLSFLGSIVQSKDLVDRFVRFHQIINVEFGYFPTARQVKAIVDKTNNDPSLIYVIVGGSSVFHGVGQHESLIWTRYLQDRLGTRFRVINLAQRAGSPTDFGNIGAEYLLRNSGRVIFVADGSSTRYASPLSNSFYRHIIFDAWQRNLLLPWSPRDTLLSSAPIDDPKLRGPALGAALDAYLNFNDLWSYFGFNVASTNWTSLLLERSFVKRSAFSDPDLLPEQYKPTRYRDDNDQAMRIERAQIVSLDSPVWQQSADLTAQMVPPRLRQISVAVIRLDSPHYRHQLTAAEQSALLETARHHAELLHQLGFNRVQLPTLDFLDEDYVDRVHLAVSGGQKLAAAIAPAVEEAARNLEYLK